MSAPFPPAVLRALAIWDRTRQLCNEGRLSWESVAEAHQALADELDDWHASRDAAMRAAEDEALEAHRASPHRFSHPYGGPT